jgi:kynurenine formamidase
MTYAHHNWNWFAEVEAPTGTTRSTAPYQTNFVVMDEHCGTHFDAPTHFVPPPDSGLDLAGPLGEQTGDKVPLEDLMGPAVVVDVRFLAEEGKPGISPFITAGHVEELSHGMRYVEILTNLGELPVRGAYFIFMPVKIAGSSGGPGRAIALLPE